MPLPPLTHHEILGLVEPFTRRGYRVDLPACDRMARRLLWQPVQHEAQPGGDGSIAVGVAYREELQLDQPFARVYQLTRRLSPPVGPPAELIVEGPNPAELLAHALAVPHPQQLRAVSGTLVVVSYLVELPQREGPAPPTTDQAAPPRQVPLRFVRAEAAVAGLTLRLAMASGRHLGATLELRGAKDDPIELPHDLLAVLGWDFSPLSLDEPGRWIGSVRVRGRGARRTRRLETRMAQVTEHLQRTLAESPRRFHERFRAARWGAAFRRAIPVLTLVFMIVGALALPSGFTDGHPALRLLLMNVPLYVLALSFTIQERARVELPPLPRPLTAAAWRPLAESPMEPHTET